jgi:hypothetical protein
MVLNKEKSVSNIILFIIFGGLLSHLWKDFCNSISCCNIPDPFNTIYELLDWFRQFEIKSKLAMNCCNASECDVFHSSAVSICSVLGWMNVLHDCDGLLGVLILLLILIET